MNNTMIFRALVLFCGVILFTAVQVKGISENKGSMDADMVEIPRIDFVEMAENQIHENKETTIWYDDFSTSKVYLDQRGKIDTSENYGDYGGSVNVGFNKGDVFGKGDRKVAFGDFPGNGPVQHPNRSFDEVYWRIYVKHEKGWEGAPAKMSRATSIVSKKWNQAMIAHVWNGGATVLTLDPARGVKGQTDSIVTTKYNDFDHLFWLGHDPKGTFHLTSNEESGYWVLVEARAKLNTPGKSDGINQLWIDGRLEIDRHGLNFRGSYTEHGINAVFLESYWNSGAIKDQGRWYDNFVIATERIGPIQSPINPTICKTEFSGKGKLAEWELQLATDYQGNEVVYKSHKLTTDRCIEINGFNGTFFGDLKKGKQLRPGQSYFGRVRQKNTRGIWSKWSRWHQGFNVQ
ncbi:hypothetical protein GO009_12990 [Muricauda sp. TY007]|uniref:hypothetical protein n=1 Tax=Allomuricauda sp. TY007 TaxID=2683200 RepID=UPI0013C1CFDE|nr:hypothetical protein [Muricauda sp. TY007]NDV16942.1 hypothetical protein [Muricauda sp. TY007]